MFWLGEGDAITPTKPKLRMNLLNLKKLAGVVYLTDELLADAAALQAWTERCYIAEASFMLDLGVIAGAGGAEMLGILNSAARVTVPKETGQSAATFQYENACNMYSRLLPGSIPNAVWFIHSTVLPQLYQMNLKIGTAGAPVFQPQGGASGQPYSTLFGRPVQVIEQASTLGTEGDAIFMDCGRYLVADRGAVQTAYSIHVRFLNDENVLRVITRTDGIPELASPITPYSGSVTQSAYVTLANR
jgi:HK97 family phage major capsid protein